MSALAILICTSANSELMGSLTEDVVYPEDLNEDEMVRMADRARQIAEARNYQSPDGVTPFTDQALPQGESQKQLHSIHSREVEHARILRYTFGSEYGDQMDVSEWILRGDEWFHYQRDANAFDGERPRLQ